VRTSAAQGSVARGPDAQGPVALAADARAEDASPPNPQLFRTPRTVLVACSGGTDSLALAAVTAFEAPRRGWRAGAVVVDHGLLPMSDAVARQAADRCVRLGLEPVEVVAVKVDKDAPEGIEAAAREARYEALEQAATRHGAEAVLLAHTLDDQAETVLLALARGAGAKALSGMAGRRGLFARPFLDLTRAQTEAIIAAEGLTAWEDPTNRPDGPYPSRRSQVRAQLMPLAKELLGRGFDRALARTAQRLRQDSDYLDAQADRLLDEAMAEAARAASGKPGRTGQGEPGGEARVRPVRAEDGEQAHEPCGRPSRATAEAGEAASGEPGRTGQGEPDLALAVAVLASAHPAIRTRALHRAAVQAGADPAALNAAQIEAIDRLVSAWRGQGPVHLAGGIQGRRKCGKLEFRSISNP
jgi:tRNA(Ile)-lysidine synthase